MNDLTPDEHGLEPPTTPPPADDTPPVPWGWLRSVLFLIGYAVLTIVLAIVAVAAFGMLSGEEFHEIINTPSGALFTLVTLATTVLVVWVFRIVVDGRSLLSLGLSFGKDERRDALAGMYWGAGLTSTVFLILLVSGQIDPGRVSFPVTGLLLQLATCAMVAATEELVTRGYLLHNLMQSANKYLALLLVSILFAVYHGFNPNVSWLGLLNIVLAGLMLGVYYVHRGNLWFPIGLHFTWNLFQGAVLGSSVSGLATPSILTFEPIGNELWTGGNFGFEASLVTTVVTVLATAAIHIKYRCRPGGDRPGIAP